MVTVMLSNSVLYSFKRVESELYPHTRSLVPNSCDCAAVTYGQVGRYSSNIEGGRTALSRGNVPHACWYLYQGQGRVTTLSITLLSWVHLDRLTMFDI